MNKKLMDISQQIGKLLLQQGLFLATAESCTGGLVASAITSIPGSSKWFERGFITYSNDAKHEMLGVKKSSLQTSGAVSEVVAREMAIGAIKYSHAKISLAITGIAGPDGGSVEKPVGMVWFAFAGKEIQTLCKQFQGDRIQIQEDAALFALDYLLESLIS